MNVPGKYRGAGMLALLFLLLPWTAWRFALRDTCAAWRDCRRLTERLEAVREERRAPGADLVCDAELIRSGALLDTLRRLVPTLQVAGYAPVVTQRTDGLALHTAELILTGDFRSLLQTVAALENALPACRLRTLAWHTSTDRRTRRTQLTLTLYLQQAVPNPE